MAGFAQIIEFTTSKFDEGQKLVDEYRAKTEGKRTSGRAITMRDRDKPNTYLIVVEFESYEAAMKNNELPETQELSNGLAALTDGEPAFRDMDVVTVEEG